MGSRLALSDRFYTPSLIRRALTVPLHGERDGVIRRELFPAGPVCHAACKGGAKFVTSSAEEYRRYARQCLEIAPTFQDEKARATLLGLARAWLRLAHLAHANRQIAELAVQTARQREIVKHALDTGQPSEMAESLLHAFEQSLGAFEKHRILSCSGSSSAPPPSDAVTGRSLSGHNGRGAS
jgi:hypothetical protein